MIEEEESVAMWHTQPEHPVVTYSSCQCSYQIMRKIFGPTRSDDGYWRIKTNQEINDILKGQNIIEFIKKKD
jgi:hypothetical protein